MPQTTAHPDDSAPIKITIPGAKHMTVKALLLAALADGVSEISGMRISQHTRTITRALSQLGIVTQLDEIARTCIIAGGNGKLPKKQATLWCANAKQIALSLLTVCAATPGVFYFDGAPALRQRIFTKSMRVLARQGAQAIPSDASRLPFTLIGSDTIEGGEIKLGEDITYPIISALLMIAPYARSPFQFIAPDLANHPDINLTCAMMSDFGVLVHRVHQGQFMVPVPQRYSACDYTIEPDLALAAYFFAAAAITRTSMIIQPINRTSSKQPDAHFLTVLETMGCKVRESTNGLIVSGTDMLQGIEVSLKYFSDIFLALTIIAPFAKSPTRILRLGDMTSKESARMLAIKCELVKLGIHVETGDKWIKIFPGKIQTNRLSAHHDPRLAMALSIMQLKLPDIKIDQVDCAKRAFPDFFDQWKKIASNKAISA